MDNPTSSSTAAASLDEEKISPENSTKSLESNISISFVLGKRERSLSLVGDPQSKRHRSNSVLVSVGNNGEFHQQSLPFNARKLNPSKNEVFKDVVDMSKIAIISREASQFHQHKFQNKIKEKNIVASDKSVKEFSATVIAMLDNRIGKFSVANSNQESWITHMLKNKEVPHVIAFLEGEMSTDDLSIEVNGKKITYLHKHTRVGISANAALDKKQDMHFFLRSDLKNTYQFENIKVPRPTSAIDTNSVDMNFVGINYLTKNKEKYQHIVVHVPNKFIGGAKDKITHKAFEDYAKKRKTNDNITVLGYMGDTNFTNPIQDQSVLSMGGVIQDGDTSKAATPFSNGAKKEKDFMQHISFDALHGNPTEHANLQPSMLNLVIPPKEKGTVGIDHPSFFARTIHTSLIDREAYASPSSIDNNIATSSASLEPKSLATGSGPPAQS